MNAMTQDGWLAIHPYLQPLASLHVQMNSVLDRILPASDHIPAWENYADDFYAGVPLLKSSSNDMDLKSAERLLTLLVERLPATPLPQPLTEQIRALDAELRHQTDAPQRAMNWLLHNTSFASSYPGLVRFLGWTVLSRHLRPLTEAFGRWRTEERWLRSYCPTCGSLPAMAQLAGKDPGRHRLLSCGCCSTRWWYQRMGCPFCEAQNNHRLAVLTIEGEARLRIDYCESCLGYLKTYDGEGNESVLLADWTSIHLDAAAQERGLKRLAASLYEL